MQWKSLFKITAKWTGGVFGLIAAILAVLLLWLSQREVQVSRFSEVPSHDQLHSLTIDVADPSMPYGPHTVDITVTNQSNEAIFGERYRLSNDGAIIGVSNIESRWLDDDRAEVCLRGAEQAEVRVSIQVTARTMVEKEGACRDGP